MNLFAIGKLKNYISTMKNTIKVKKGNFKGGVHPLEGKKFTENKSIEFFGIPKIVSIPLAQHIGAPAKALVKVGDVVLKGQKIGEASSFISANIHASTSGKVIQIKKMVNTLGAKVDVIVIETDGEDNSVEFQERDWTKLEPKEIIEIVKEKGIVGMGGATFPSNVKLMPPPDFKIDTLVVNGVECEPYLTADHRVMLEYSENVLEGIKILLHTLKINKAYVGIEANKMNAIEKLILTNNDERIEIVPLEVKYPQGAEKQLIYATTKREVPSGGLPAAAGVVVMNIGTVNAIYNAVVKDIPLIERVTTVTGPIHKKPANFLVRIGTNVKELLERTELDYDKLGKLIMGGPMMGHAMYTDEYPIIKGSSGVLCLPTDETEVVEQYPCISCGKCVEVCPIDLMPTMLAKASKNKDYVQADKLSAMDCIECGSCTYTCPAKLDLAQRIKIAKINIIKMKRKK